MGRPPRKFLIWFGATVAIGCAIAYLALPSILYGSLAKLNAQDGLVLYSIDGWDYPPGHAPQLTELFHGYPVLGKVAITDPDKQIEIVGAIQSGVARSDWWSIKKCFWPRHGIRAVSAGKTVDLVICFECDRIRVYYDGGESSEPTNDKSRTMLNESLKAAGIPLAPIIESQAQMP